MRISHISFIALLSPPLLFSQTALRVQSIAPAAQFVAEKTNPEIVVQFDRAIDVASLTQKSFSVFGRWTGVMLGDFLLENDGKQVRFRPAKAFSAGEWITVSLSKDIRSQTGQTLPNGYSWNFWTPAGKASLDLVEKKRVAVRRAGEGRIQTYGAYGGDLNGDGYHDFTVPNELSSDVRVFMNDGAGDYGKFTIHALPLDATPSTNEGADFNGDGLLDFAVGNITGNSMSVFLGDGAGGFSDLTTYPSGVGVRGLSVIDANSDGAPDIVTANRVSSDATLFLNNGDGTFAGGLYLETGGLGETSAAVADANNDGIADLFIGCFYSQEIILLLGDGQGSFTVSARADCDGDAWMLAAGDLNGDGHVDVVSTNARQGEFAVLLGNGQGDLGAAKIYSTGAFALAIDLGDLDGDGDLDLITSNYSSNDWWLFENDGLGNYVKARVFPASAAGSCAVFHDRDRDGDLDMTGIDEVADLLFLFENPGSPTGIEITDQTQNIPDDIALLQSYPNPFSKSNSASPQKANSIAIPFSLQQPGNVRLEIYDIRGTLLARIADESFARGTHVLRYNATTLAPGIYFYRLISGTRHLQRKFVIVR